MKLTFNDYRIKDIKKYYYHIIVSYNVSDASTSRAHALVSLHLISILEQLEVLKRF
jgi:hypothetical protein